jgi:hypothetical protein
MKQDQCFSLTQQFTASTIIHHTILHLKTKCRNMGVVSICSEQEKKHACLQPRDLHSYIDLVPIHQIHFCIHVAKNVN